MNINTTKLNETVELVRKNLNQFNIVKELKPYYCGMGYVGLEILVDENSSEKEIKEVEKYYETNHNKRFFAYKITKGGTTDEIKPYEILYVGEDGPYRPL